MTAEWKLFLVCAGLLSIPVVVNPVLAILMVPLLAWGAMNIWD